MNKKEVILKARKLRVPTEFPGLLEQLRAFTEPCRLDMHEPDEQGIRALVVGSHLDNAFGEEIFEDPGYQEYVVILAKESGEVFKINLASLIALARLSAYGLKPVEGLKNAYL